MRPPDNPVPDAAPLGAGSPVAAWMPRATGTLAVSLAGWGFLAWIALDMDHPVAQLMMPGDSNWSTLNILAMLVMWAIMMAAMMLPSALPMIVAFVRLSTRGAQPVRAWAFVAAYLLVWTAFSAIATALQWALQAQAWVDPMIVSTSPMLTAVLLAIAGVYQFSSLKQVCLAHCRTPLGFLFGEWRSGVAGAFAMGVRHGLYCTGCCWALMALLFVGGVMNLAWIAALSIVVGVEKMAPHGGRFGKVLGGALIVAGAVKLLVLAVGAA